MSGVQSGLVYYEMNLKVTQINFSQVPLDLLSQNVVDERANLVIISELYKIRDNNAWIHDKSQQVAMWTSGKQTFQEIEEGLEGFARAKINNMNFYSYYPRPSWTVEKFQKMWRQTQRLKVH